MFACRGCGSDVADDESDGFGGALTTHDGECASHNRFGRCRHAGRCYEPSTNPEIHTQGDER